MLMGYIYLIGALFCIVLQFSFAKIFQKFVKQCLMTSLIFIVLRTVTQCIFFYVYGIIVDPSNAVLHITLYSGILSVVLAVATILCTVFGLLVMFRGNLSVYSLFMMLGGMLLPFIQGAIFQPELNPLSPARWIAVFLLPIFLVLQVVFDNKDNKTEGQKSNRKDVIIFYVLCFLTGILNGTTSIVQNLESNPIGNFATMNPEQFTCFHPLLTAIVAVIVILVVYFRGDRNENKELLKQTLKSEVIIVTVIQAIISGIGSFLLLLANGIISAVVEYPIISGGTIVLSAVVSAFIFKEKQKTSTIIFLSLSALATVLFLF